ncbi:hypothetical protein [Aurantimonas endophytica]|uniref:Uncharacterized protein n=1 Tax=Aurantimonas endophytica TaxID=1522175 RepID=A0A7W6HAD6_9HYPH|nr:hypothetical protein [Aurantimonas endophytica]MBB4001570.1 hypothetical protein [Aurantimonas endophytica]MCO6402790.1 hypothetical protein [Aurantimonas endophytica]
MNVSTHTTAAREPATNPFRFEAEYPAEATKIRAMEGGELIILVDGLIAAMDAYLSIVNMPRCQEDSPSHCWLDYEMERLGAIREMAMEEMQRRPFDGGHDDDERIRCIVAYLVECGEPVGELLDQTAQMVKAQDTAKRQRRHISEIGKLIVNAIVDDGLTEREQIAASIRERLAPDEVNDADLQAAADHVRAIFDEAEARAAA